MSMLGTEQPKEYKDGRTKQSFKDETDVNKILAKHSRMGTLSHLEQWGGQYGDLTGFNFQEAQNQMAKANSMFEQLPAEIRREFRHNAEAFFEYVNDPANKDDLATKLPALAKPGTQLPNVRPTGANPPAPDPTPPTPPTPGGGTTQPTPA
uniref:hypothetical protein n=1 Tax=Shewanella sp. TaxID=50422 RepID=UPI004047F662